jgi:prolyl-tRNA editing enzyme YbaK/EbsC (Cys-tRNA(Pro) deacylase)
MDNNLSNSASKVQDALAQLGLPCKVVEMPASTRTAVEAAQAIGCTVGQIVKSLIFKSVKSQQAVLILASGTNRVDIKRIEEYIGEAIEKADPEFVREQTGFAIGGVPPLGFSKPLRTLIDRDLLTYPEIWAAAGTPHAVFQILPADLVTATNGQVIQIDNPVVK